MNLKSLLATAMAVLLLVSCTKEVTKEIYIEKEEGPTKIKIALSPGDNGTKAGNHYNLKPTDDENLIYNYALFIFNSSGLLEESLIATISSTSNGAKSYTDPEFADGLTFSAAENPGKIDDNGLITLTAGNKNILCYCKCSGSFACYSE
ncbi:MAG: hypothetical protein LUE98_21260 [Tannerellaceae bacterium]|nr:hypothetical protein [Tannerellaceae bacterium]